MKPVMIEVAALTLFAGAFARADYAQEVLKDCPVACWQFQDSASTGGAAAKDETGRHPGVYHRNTIAHLEAAGRLGQRNSPQHLPSRERPCCQRAQPLVPKAEAFKHYVKNSTRTTMNSTKGASQRGGMGFSEGQYPPARLPG